MPIMDYIATLTVIKAALAGYLTDKGITASATEPFSDLVDKVADIVVGVDTSDATAVAGDIVSPKTAYGANGEKLTGTLALTGDAAVGDVLAGKKFYKDDPTEQLTGTLTPGYDTSDATADASRIEEGYTAYVASGKITGTMPVDKTHTNTLTLLAPPDLTITTAVADI